MITYIKNRIKRFLDSYYYNNYARNMLLHLRIRAQKDACRFVECHLHSKPYIPDRYKFLKYVIDQVKINGTWLELGVWKGNDAKFISKYCHTLYAFDSFEGLPNDWIPDYPKGKFKTKIPKLPDNVKLHIGWIKDTLPKFSFCSILPIAFVHLDLDVYSSTKEFFDICNNQIVNGTIIVFDEYFGFPFWRRNEHKAFMQWNTDNNVIFEYLCYGDAQLAVKIIKR